MIIDEVGLENFGVYLGSQYIELTPAPNRPVVLCGGLNGGGKTTLLEAIQLGLYGNKAARLSSRAGQTYSEFLRSAINRNADPSEGASIRIRFRRIVEGETKQYELLRAWRVGVQDVEENLSVRCNGEPDEFLTANWAEYIDSYLPHSIANLFFFDGEQIMEIADGSRAAEILHTAIHTLLGLDIVDRLDADLKVLERRKRNESLSSEARIKLELLNKELKAIDSEQEHKSLELGATTNSAAVIAKRIHKIEEVFRKEGGDLFLKRSSLEDEYAQLCKQKAGLDVKLRELASGSSPLLLLMPSLAQYESTFREQAEIRMASSVVRILEKRDATLMDSLFRSGMPAPQRRAVSEWLNEDRSSRMKNAGKRLFLDTDVPIAEELHQLRAKILPRIRSEISELRAEASKIEKRISTVEAQLTRVPSADSIAKTMEELDEARRAHEKELARRSALEAEVQALQKRRSQIEQQIESTGARAVDDQFAEEDRTRTLAHSGKVRSTLERYRVAVIQRHVTRLEELIFESFTRLLRKRSLVSAIRIDPSTFELQLIGPDQNSMNLNRLSAGERQLLATAVLWGLARASGRPMPTIIDTPLGRLDSSHRTNLVESYFPVASHQVVLLSTDQEITGHFLTKLKPSIARTYLLKHDDRSRSTTIHEGFFE